MNETHKTLDFTTKGFQKTEDNKKKIHNFDFTTQGIQKDKILNN